MAGSGGIITDMDEQQQIALSDACISSRDTIPEENNK